MIPLRLLGLVITLIGTLCAGVIGFAITIAPEVNQGWSVTYATTNGSQSFWRLHLLDVDRDVFFTLVDAEMLAASLPAISPNERYVVLEGTRLVLMDLWQNKTYQMQQGGGNVVWTPDNTRFAYLHEGEAYITVVDEQTGPTELLIPIGISLSDYLVGWSPNGQQLVYIHRDTLMLLDIRTGEHHTLISDEDVNFRFVEWSPDGRHLLVSFNFERNMNRYVLQLLPMTDVSAPIEPMTLFDQLDRVVNLKWSPDGQRIVLVEMPGNVRTMRILSLLPDQGRITGDLLLPLDARQVQWSPDGRRLLFINQRDADLYVVDAIGSNLRRVTDNNMRNVLLR